MAMPMPPNGPADDLASAELLIDDPAAIGDRDDARDPQHAELWVDSDFGEARAEGAGRNRGVRGAHELAAEPAQPRHGEGVAAARRRLGALSNLRAAAPGSWCRIRQRVPGDGLA